MKGGLDLTALDRALASLVDALGPNSLEDVVVDAGGLVQDAWRGNVESAGLVDTGEYRDSITVEAIEPQKFAGVLVEISTDARTEKGEPYPFFLEYGTSDIFPHPVAQRAFDTRRRAVVKQVGEGVARKVRSRVKR